MLNVAEMLTKALLIDRQELSLAQQAGDVLGANQIYMDAFYTDVRSSLAAWREERGLPADPMRAYQASGYAEQIISSRRGGAQAGWGA